MFYVGRHRRPEEMFYFIVILFQVFFNTSRSVGKEHCHLEREVAFQGKWSGQMDVAHWPKCSNSDHLLSSHSKQQVDQDIVSQIIREPLCFTSGNRQGGLYASRHT
ncbi:hypothetical protein AVEN_208495-1 [Araneus ventricosus]|uniref:Uncharacterized protein n=1 Tax=Araneus ventricosus TaxID=182803 RepID=A0A4Y2E4Q6_ARAVE|nr:hypothetical protein AVEN_208495-1 [Araneus ventricosus]